MATPLARARDIRNQSDELECGKPTIFGFQLIQRTFTIRVSAGSIRGTPVKGPSENMSGDTTRAKPEEIKIMLVTRYLTKDLFKGKTVFVTGGGSGINLGVAKNFAALGANVAICGRTKEKLDAAAAELTALGAKVCAVVADVRDFTALEAAFARSREELGPMDVLVCGAAGNFLVRAERLSANGFNSVVGIDLVGSFNASRAAFEQLRTTKGTVIYISAGMAYMPHAFQVHVGAAKAGIDMMMKNLALEWGRYGIRTNSIVPGPIEGTEGMKRLPSSEGVINAIPLRRMGTVDDIGQTAVFLASPLASYVSGCVMVVDGGQNLAGSAPFNMRAETMLRAE
jgi:NAD(P)-dependent dehydrogenase (short-subunit alcohol dehydrogenase family)